MENEMTETRYSINNEDFTWEDIDGVIDDFVCDDIKPLGKTYYECEFRPLKFSDILPADAMLQIADERADDILNQYDNFDAIIETTKEGVAELDKLLAEWAEKYLSLSYTLIPIGVPIERVISERDLSGKGE